MPWFGAASVCLWDAHQLSLGHATNVWPATASAVPGSGNAECTEHFLVQLPFPSLSKGDASAADGGEMPESRASSTDQWVQGPMMRLCRMAPQSRVSRRAHARRPEVPAGCALFRSAHRCSDLHTVVAATRGSATIPATSLWTSRLPAMMGYTQALCRNYR